MSHFCRTMWALLNSRYYPLVAPEIDLRYRLPRKELRNMNVLNIGVGDGNSGLARQIPFIDFGSLTMIDVHEPYLDAARQRVYDARKVKFMKADGAGFNVEDYDLVMMFDVLEHLPKEASLNILRRCTGRQLIFIPLEDHFRSNVYEVPAQEHLSLWTEQDFKDLGYKTDRLKYFHNEDGHVFDALWASK